MTESQWTRKICYELIDCGCLVHAVVGNRWASVGWPDRHVILPTGEMFWLEFKSADGKLSKSQKYVMDEINRRARGRALVVRMPGHLETADGELIRLFDGGGRDLFLQLRKLRELPV
jgi:hypothetical protein